MHVLPPRGWIRVLVMLVLGGLLLPALSAAQVEEGATMTVLRGEVAVVRPNGSAVQPAPSGTTLRVGDEIRTLSKAGALITFFVGTEIELGEDTILVVERVTKQGERIDVSLKQVLGTSLNRIQTLADPGSSYRIAAGGAVAVVRGTEFLLLGPSSEGFVILVCLSDCDSRTSFGGTPLGPFMGYIADALSGRVVGTFRPDPAAGYWNSAFDGLRQAVEGGRPSIRGRSPGLVPQGSNEEAAADRSGEKDKDKKDEAPSPGGIPELTPTPTPEPTPGAQRCNEVSNSGGAGVTTTVHELGATSGTFVFDYDAFSIPDRFDITYDGAVIFTTGGFVSGSNSVPVRFGPGRSTTITVTVTGSTAGTAWTYTVRCPK